MQKAISFSPDDTLTHIETLLEGIYDQVQAIRYERSQEQAWENKLQQEVKKARFELERGDFTDIKTQKSLIAHFDGLTERADAQASHHKTI
jgi:hypothetical protein